ncbi:MAG: hypothetical protein KDI37_17770 [Xanthomonadales bacterium]|nr:hypothetical protein [Xanthomonadales bacterium]MCB1643584.1 hypothetical protein [Xanthomonadales bacterium]
MIMLAMVTSTAVHGMGLQLARLALSVFGVVAIARLLSWLWQVPYATTALGLSALVLLGHVLTLDDDMPGGWCNPEGQAGIWRTSLMLLAAKFVWLGALITVIVQYPGIKAYGA